MSVIRSLDETQATRANKNKNLISNFYLQKSLQVSNATEKQANLQAFIRFAKSQLLSELCIVVEFYLVLILSLLLKHAHRLFAPTFDYC